MLILRAIGIWLLIEAAMLYRAAFQDAVLRPALGEIPAQVCSTLLGLAIIVVLTASFVGSLREKGPRQLLGVGLFWVALAVFSEMALGYGLTAVGWNETFGDQVAGQSYLRVVLLVLAVVTPFVWHSLHRRPEDRKSIHHRGRTRHVHK